MANDPLVRWVHGKAQTATKQKQADVAAATAVIRDWRDSVLSVLAEVRRDLPAVIAVASARDQLEPVMVERSGFTEPGIFRSRRYKQREPEPAAGWLLHAEKGYSRHSNRECYKRTFLLGDGRLLYTEAVLGREHLGEILPDVRILSIPWGPAIRKIYNLAGLTMPSLPKSPDLSTYKSLSRAELDSLFHGVVKEAENR